MALLRAEVSEFKTNLDTFLQQAAAGAIIHLTCRGREVAQLVLPDYAKRTAQQELNKLRKTAVIGDILSPLDELWKIHDWY